MAPPRSGCCQGAPSGEPGALFWGREGPGVPPIILPSPGRCGCPPCLPLVGDVGAPLLREGGPWVTHCLAVLKTCWGGPILPHCPVPAPFPASLCPPSTKRFSGPFPLCPPIGEGGGLSSCCFPLPLGGLDPSIQTARWEAGSPWPLSAEATGQSPSKNAGSLTALGAQGCHHTLNCALGAADHLEGGMSLPLLMPAAPTEGLSFAGAAQPQG